MAEALYRKYRPQVFEDVVGQEHIERTIKNAIEQDKVSHAYLFTGPRGTGKTTTARLLAKALLCENGPTADPDGTCEDCELIAAGEHPDVYELDAASRTGVENVREEIIGRVQFAPTRGRYKVYIIDEVHMLSIAAFNALLKTLEEPPDHVVFILATTDPQKVPETIHSRCQRFDFRRISNEAIVSRLGAICVAEGIEFEGDALELIAHRCDGGMRNALTSLEQLIVFGEGSVTMEVAERMLGTLDVSELSDIVRYVGTRDVAACFRWTAEFVETGADLAQFTRDFAEHVRNMYVMSLTNADVALDVSDAARRELVEELPLFGPDRLARLLGVLGDLSAELKTSTNQRLSFEIALTRMVRPDSDLTLESLAERIESLEAGRSAAAPAFAQAAAPVAREVVPARTQAQARSQSQPQVQLQSQPQAQPSEPLRRQLRPQEAPAGAARAQGERASAQRPRAAEEAGRSARDLDAARAMRDASQVAAAATTQGEPSTLDALRNPAALQRMWQTTIAALKKAKAAYGVLFLNARAHLDEAAGCLVIDFPADGQFMYKAVQKPEILDMLAATLASTCGGPVPYKLTIAGAGSVAGPAAASSARVASSGGGPSGDAHRAQDASAHSAASGQAAPAASAQAMRDASGRAVGQSASRRPDGARDAAGHDAGATLSGPVPRADATSQASPVTAYESPAGYAGYDDVVPLDAYENMYPYDDEPPYYFDSSEPPRSSAPASSAGSQADTAGRASGQGAAAPSVSTDPHDAAPSVAFASSGKGGAASASSSAAAGTADVAGFAASSAAGLSGAAVSAPVRDEGSSAVGPSNEDIAAALVAGFGEGVVFEEV